MWTTKRFACLIGLAIALSAPAARADINTDWDTTACDVIAAAKPVTPAAVRILAITQTAAFDAVKRATAVDVPGGGSALDTSVDAAVAAAYRSALLALVPTQTTMIEDAYRQSISAIADGPAKSAGLAIGERAAAEVLARRADDGASGAESYRPIRPFFLDIRLVDHI